ncbi:MAG: hypothetical protein GY801_41760, partial [bacterium]|nr:hypothetical protein [bacterium]
MIYEQVYFVKYALSLPERESVALGILQEISEGFEGMQASFFYDTAMHIVGKAGSGFSEEDLPSDLIAFYRAIRGFTRPYIDRLCHIIPNNNDAEELWDEIGGLKQVMPSSWDPQNYNSLTCGCSSNEMNWPK